MTTTENATINRAGVDESAGGATLDDLGSRIVGLSGRLAAATCRWLLLVAEFDARDGCARFGLGSTARWLSYACGISARTAVEHVRVARGLAAFPSLVTAMSAGRLSYSHVRAITRLASAGEERLVADLIEVAEHGSVGQLEVMVRGLRTVDDLDPAPAGVAEPSAGSEPSGGSEPSARSDPSADPGPYLAEGSTSQAGTVRSAAENPGRSRDVWATDFNSADPDAATGPAVAASAADWNGAGEGGSFGGGAGEGEYLSHGWTAGSRWRMSTRLDPERGALVQSVIESIGRAEQITYAGALVRMAEIASAAVTDLARRQPTDDDTDQNRDPKNDASEVKKSARPRGLRGDERAAIVIHLNAADLPGADPGLRTASSLDQGSERKSDRKADRESDRKSDRKTRSREREPGGWARAERLPGQDPVQGAGSHEAAAARPYAHLDRGPGLPDRVVRRLLCSGRIRTVVHGPVDAMDAQPGGMAGGTHSDVLDLGRSHRVVTDRQVHALQLRGGAGCGHPGCTTVHGVEAHHVRHWIDDGRTDLDNLVLLCQRHHHAHHDAQFRIEPRGRGRFRFFRADGAALPAHADPARHIRTAAPVDSEQSGVTVDAATTRWTGSRLDRAWAISVLADRRQHERPAC